MTDTGIDEIRRQVRAKWSDEPVDHRSAIHAANTTTDTDTEVMGAAAQLERGLIVKRLKCGRRAKAAAGGYATGAPAYGQQAVDHELTEHPEEADTLRHMREWREEGAGVREIARRLNDAGIPSKRGGKWHPTAVAHLLDPAAREAARAKSASARAAKKAEETRTRAQKTLGRLG